MIINVNQVIRWDYIATPRAVLKEANLWQPIITVSVSVIWAGKRYVVGSTDVVGPEMYLDRQAAEHFATKAAKELLLGSSTDE